MSTLLASVREFWGPLEIVADINYIQSRRRRERRILQILETIGFSWRIYAVAAVGFLASSWSLIAINIISPALYFIYPTNSPASQDAGRVLDIVTLASIVIGMIVSGYLSDKWGRSSVYGFELLILLSAIGGAAFSSNGFMSAVTDPVGKVSYESSMNIYNALFWWRAVLGLGIGAEYPMSAVIAVEFTSTAYRGTMLAAVFLAQPVGRLLAYGIGLGVLRGLNSAQNPTTPNEVKILMDDVWRLVLGLAGIPAVFAIGLRLPIPETPRYYSAIKKDLVRARDAARTIVPSPSSSQVDDMSLNLDADEGLPTSNEPRTNRPLAYFFGSAQRWKPLMAISVQWFLLDIVFYGTGLDNPATLAALYMSGSPQSVDYSTIDGFGLWKEDYANPYASIVQTMDDNAVRTLQLSSIAALAGSVGAIFMINYVTRKTLYVWTSFTLTVLFSCMAVTTRTTYGKPEHIVGMIFYALAQFVFNLGPNTLTFVIAAEIFSTEFRGTSYGIAAASGKVGAIVVRLIISYAGHSQNGLVILFSVFAGITFIMGLLARFEPWGMAIEIQKPRETTGPVWERIIPTRLENKKLEKIARWPDVGDDSESEDEGNNEMSDVESPHTSGAVPHLSVEELELQTHESTVESNGIVGHAHQDSILELK